MPLLNLTSMTSPLRSGPTPPTGVQLAFDELDTPLRGTTFVVVDLETTGHRPDDGGVTEIGAIRLEGLKEVGRYQTLVHPGRPIPSFVTKLTGISDAMVALFDRGNTEQLAAAGYAATPGNLYLAHHFGAAGAKKILGAADDTPMQSLVSRAAWRANPHLHGKTKAQVLADFARRGGAPAAFAASAQSATAQAPATGPARTAAYTPFTPMAQARNSNAAPMPIWRPTPLPASSPVPPLAPTSAPAAYALPTATTTPIPDARTRPVTAFDPTAPRPDPPAESLDPPANEPTPLEQLLRMLR